MSLGVLALVLTAAFTHAGWNLLAKGAGGGAAFVWLAAVAASVVYLPVLVLALAVSPGELGASGLGLMAGSGALHCLYFVLLQRAYATGDLSLVYPLARGTGPLLSTAAAIALLGERPSAQALAGAAIIVAAVFSLVARPRDAHGHAARAATGFAVATGAVIALYTLWDKHAVDAAGLSPVVYYWGTNLVNVALITPWAVRRPAALRAAWGSRTRAAGLAVLAPLAYVLVLYALARAPVSYVAPVRESSILIGTVLGTIVLAEGDARRRFVAAAAIVLGVVALATG